MNNEDTTVPWHIWHELSNDYFYTPEEGEVDELSDLLMHVDLNQFNDLPFLAGHNNEAYYFPKRVITAVRVALNQMDIMPKSASGIGNLVYLFFLLDKRIYDLRFPTVFTQNTAFEKERDGFYNVIQMLGANNMSLISANLKLAGATPENDLIIKDPHVLDYLKQLILIGADRAKQVETLGYYYRMNFESIRTTKAYKASKTLLPLEKEEFKSYDKAILKVFGQIKPYKRTQLMSKVLLALGSLNQELLSESFAGQKTHKTKEKYIQEKIKKKIA